MDFFRPVLIVYAVLIMFSGIGGVLMQRAFLAGFVVELSPMGLIIYQFRGAALIGVGLPAAGQPEFAGDQRRPGPFPSGFSSNRGSKDGSS